MVALSCWALFLLLALLGSGPAGVVWLASGLVACLAGLAVAVGRARARRGDTWQAALVAAGASVLGPLSVALRITNHSGVAATVELSAPSHPGVHVAPSARATLQTAGLKDGTYRILVNGTPRGQLMIGAQGGP